MTWIPRPLSLFETVALLALAAAAAYAGRRLWRAGRTGVIPFLWRFAALTLAVALFIPPGRFASRSRPAVAWVLDGSSSMGAPAGRGGGPSRWEDALSLSARDRAFLSRRAAPAYFRLDGRLDPLEGGPPTGASSDFTGLTALPSRVAGLKAVFFFSDGRRGRAPAWEDFSRMGVPVHVVALGALSEGPNLSLESARAAPFGFEDVEMSAALRVRLSGRAEAAVAAVVSNRGRVVGRASVTLREGVSDVSVSFRPPRRGLEVFEVSLTPLPGETNKSDNGLSLSVDVGRQRRRVLYLAGRPGPHYAFLRHQLKSDPTVDLVTFVILRDAEDFLPVPDREMSLIPFPSQDKLLEGLPAFDAVIFENFNFMRYGLGFQGPAALRRLVEKGGGFLIIDEGAAWGAPSGLQPGSLYRGTPLEPLLPFRLDVPAEEGPSRYTLTAPNPRPPLAPLPVLDGVSLEGDGFFPAGLAPGAVPLLFAGKHPWLAVRAEGRGRVAGMAGSAGWRWALSENGDPAAYALFWERFLSWLSGEDDFRRVRFFPPEGADREEVLLRAAVGDDARRPVEDADVRARIFSPTGEASDVLLPSLGGGEYAGLFRPQGMGRFRVTVSAKRSGRSWGEDRAVVRLGTQWEESRNFSPDEPWLAALAESTGGRFFPGGRLPRAAVEELLREAAADEKAPPRPRSFLWGLPLLLVLAGEWFWRRRRSWP